MQRIQKQTKTLQKITEMLSEEVKLVIETINKKQFCMVNNYILYKENKTWYISDLEHKVVYKSDTLNQAATQFVLLEGRESICSELNSIPIYQEEPYIEIELN